MKEVQLVSTGIYQPGESIPFDKIEDVLGNLDKAPSKIKKLIPRLRKLMTDILLVKNSHFAFDPKTKAFTDSNTSMTVRAIKTALEKASMKPEEIECIILGTPIPDYLMPTTPPLIQAQLGIEHCAEIEIHSNCSSITKAFQIGFDALRLERYRSVVVAYSQMLSPCMISDYYNQEKIKSENILLRWFLSDSAAAAILTAKDKVNSGIKLTSVYNDSMGSKLKPGMWLNLGAVNSVLPKVYDQGLHHFGQDYGMVNEMAPEVGEEGLRRLLNQLHIKGKEIDHIIFAVPSKNRQDDAKKLGLKEFSIPLENWFSNVEEKGYCGGASLIIGIDEMLEKNLFRPGELMVCLTVESAKWMVGGFILEYV